LPSRLVVVSCPATISWKIVESGPKDACITTAASFRQVTSADSPLTSFTADSENVL
jgi:hypothetical protein